MTFFNACLRLACGLNEVLMLHDEEVFREEELYSIPDPGDRVTITKRAR